jgi:hypothetical protein
MVTSSRSDRRFVDVVVCRGVDRDSVSSSTLAVSSPPLGASLTGSMVTLTCAVSSFPSWSEMVYWKVSLPL